MSTENIFLKTSNHKEESLSGVTGRAYGINSVIGRKNNPNEQQKNPQEKNNQEKIYGKREYLFPFGLAHFKYLNNIFGTPEGDFFRTKGINNYELIKIESYFIDNSNLDNEEKEKRKKGLKKEYRGDLPIDKYLGISLYKIYEIYNKLFPIASQESLESQGYDLFKDFSDQDKAGMFAYFLEKSIAVNYYASDYVVYNKNENGSLSEVDFGKEIRQKLIDNPSNANELFKNLYIVSRSAKDSLEREKAKLQQKSTEQNSQNSNIEKENGDIIQVKENVETDEEQNSQIFVPKSENLTDEHILSADYPDQLKNIKNIQENISPNKNTQDIRQRVGESLKNEYNIEKIESFKKEKEQNIKNIQELLKTSKITKYTPKYQGFIKSEDFNVNNLIQILEKDLEATINVLEKEQNKIWILKNSELIRQNQNRKDEIEKLLQSVKEVSKTRSKIDSNIEDFKNID